jgi:lactoylglutathione lyase
MRMAFTIVHNNYNVKNLDESLAFYEKALGLTEARRSVAADGSFILVYLTDGRGAHQIELTWLRDHPQPYDLGENEIHLAVRADDYDAAHALHQAMGCICYENDRMGLYFIEDPDGYWIEIVPVR